MRRLRDETGETVALFVPEGAFRLCIAEVPSNQALSFRRGVWRKPSCAAAPARRWAARHKARHDAQGRCRTDHCDGIEVLVRKFEVVEVGKNDLDAAIEFLEFSSADVRLHGGVGHAHDLDVALAREVVGRSTRSAQAYPTSPDLC